MFTVVYKNGSLRNMIYVADDYLEKYIETFGYIFSCAFSKKYSPNYIEHTIANSTMVNELENSNVTTIAFVPSNKIYKEMFLLEEEPNLEYSPYSIYGWMGFVYVNLFFKYQVTFETLFMVFPLEKCLNAYRLYHEMDITNMYQLFEENIKYSFLNVIMVEKEISSKKLSLLSGVSFATIQSLRYGKRDINKLESMKLHNLSSVLNIKMSSLLTNLNLKIEE